MRGSLVNNRGGTGTTGLPMKRINYSILQNISSTEPSARKSIWSGVEQLARNLAAGIEGNCRLRRASEVSEKS